MAGMNNNPKSIEIRFLWNI